MPTDQTSGLIMGRLAYLSANCGGKPDNISNGKGFIRFGCKDDAQRCQPRIDGQNVFGHNIQVSLFDGDPKAVKKKTPVVANQKGLEQNSSPKASKVKNKTLNEQNLAKNASKIQTDLTQIKKPSEGDDCRSIIKGLTYNKGTDLTKLIKDLIIGWNDQQLKPEFIKIVQGGKLSDKKIGDTLHVFAISPEANKLLVFRSKKYLKESGIKWFFKTSATTQPNGALIEDKKAKNKNKLNDISVMSVIRGLETKKDDNVAKMVRKIVQKWADRAVQPNYIKTVERDRKYADKDGMVLLFVTAQNADNNRALVEAAQRHSSQDGIEWTAYQRKRNNSRDTDTESNVSESFEFIPSLKSSAQNLSGKPTVKKPTAIEVPVTDDMLSVITGLETKKGENLAKVVRKILMNWRDPKLNGNLIKDVERFPGFAEEDGKVPLRVTAISPMACLTLVAGAEYYLKPSDGIIWSLFKSDISSASKSSDCLGASAPPIPLNLKFTPNESIPKLEVKPQPFGPKQDNGSSAPSVFPKLSPIKVYEPKQIQIFKGCPVKQEDTPLFDVESDDFVANHFNRNLSSPLTYGTPFHQSSLNTGSQYPMTGGRADPITISDLWTVSDRTSNAKKDDNLLKSLISGFESLFKSSKSSPKKLSTTVKTVDSSLISDSSQSSMTSIYCPEIPFNQSFLGGLYEGYTLCISGRPNTSADCFAINFFVNNTDIAFHFNVRLPQSLVVRNSLINGIWGPEEREIPYFPFIVGQTFGIIIKVKPHKYVIEVNGQHFCDYEHRIAISSVTKLSIIGAVSIDCLRTT